MPNAQTNAWLAEALGVQSLAAGGAAAQAATGAARGAASAAAANGSASGYIRYQIDATDPATKFSDLEGGAEFYFTKHWGLGLSGVRDLEANAWRLRDVSLIYKDECVRVQVIYQHQDTIQGQLGSSDTVLLRLTLATLGAEGYRDTDIPH